MPRATKLPLMFTVEEVAAQLGISRNAVRRRARLMGAVQINKGYVLFPRQIAQMRKELADKSKHGRKVRLKEDTHE